MLRRLGRCLILVEQGQDCWWETALQRLLLRLNRRRLHAVGRLLMLLRRRLHAAVGRRIAGVGLWRGLLRVAVRDLLMLRHLHHWVHLLLLRRRKPLRQQGGQKLLNTLRFAETVRIAAIRSWRRGRVAVVLAACSSSISPPTPIEENSRGGERER